MGCDPKDNLKGLTPLLMAHSVPCAGDCAVRKKKKTPSERALGLSLTQLLGWALDGSIKFLSVGKRYSQFSSHVELLYELI